METMWNPAVLKNVWVLLFSLFTAGLGLLLSWAIQFKGFRSIPNGRRDALKRTWKGEVHQQVGTTRYPDRYPIEMRLDPIWRFILGRAKYLLGDQEVHLKLIGGFYDEHYIKVNYRNEKRGVIQYGLLMLRFSSAGEELKGRFLGYGHLNETLVAGEVVLRPDASATALT